MHYLNFYPIEHKKIVSIGRRTTGESKSKFEDGMALSTEMSLRVSKRNY
jgi:hypothetical protein